MKYEEAVEFIESAATFGSKMGLENIGFLLNLLGNPQDDVDFVHVAGTNGKGSVCSFIAHVLVESGYRTGLFTSPYLEKFTERIQVDFYNIPDEKLIEYVVLLKEKTKEMTDAGKNHPTFFELNTAIAFLYFRDMKCDVAVLETGLGGRLDSTNIIKSPMVSVITSIGLDHTKILGETIPEIAFEKAGIIKPKKPVVAYGGIPKEALSVIKDRAKELSSEYIEANPDEIDEIRDTPTGAGFNYAGVEGYEINLLGRHQIYNAITAIEALNALNEQGLSIKRSNIFKGLALTKWPGRIEILNKNPLVICDAAHNPQGAEVLRKTLEERYSISDIVFVMGVMKDKDFDSMASFILPGAKGVVAVRPNWHRALDAEILLETTKRYCKNSQTGDTIEEGLGKALDMAGKEGIICTFGSLYYIADVKRFVRERLIGIQ